VFEKTVCFRGVHKTAATPVACAVSQWTSAPSVIQAMFERRRRSTPLR